MRAKKGPRPLPRSEAQKKGPNAYLLPRPEGWRAVAGLQPKSARLAAVWRFGGSRGDAGGCDRKCRVWRLGTSQGRPAAPPASPRGPGGARARGGSRT